MSTAVRLPEELRSFLSLEGPQTLLVRGPPGSGKTTLTLALLEAFRGDKFLVTSRVPQAELSREFPWLGANGGRAIQVVDTSRMDQTVHHSARLIRQSRDHLFQPESTEERELTRFLWLPPPLQEAWSRMDPRRPSLVVIDSWDALVEAYLGPGDGPDGAQAPDRGQLERILIRRMSDAPSHLIFVLEREDQTALDYLVNGVVETHRDVVSDRLQRWMTILKLRGVRIDNATYPYTLEGARLESILPMPPYASLHLGRPDPEPDTMLGHLWPGSKAFASAFGRLAYGKTTLIELEETASGEVADLLVLPIVAHVIGRGGRVLRLLHSSATPRDLYQGLKPFVSRQQFLDHVRVIVPPGPEPVEDRDLWRVAIPMRAPAPASAHPTPEEPEALKFVREGATEQAPGLIVVSLQGLLATAAAVGAPINSETITRLPQAFQSTVRDSSVHLIVIARREEELSRQLRALATIRIHGEVRQGRIFLHGVVPWTPAFLLVEGSEASPYELKRVV